jgi:HK97 family phage prohead protease
MAFTGFSTKSIAGGILDVDTAKRSVKVAISQMDSIDRDEDMIVKGAFNKTIKEKGPKGSNEIWHLTDHKASLLNALGKFKELYVDGDKLVGISTYKDTALWRDVMWPLYDSGDVDQHSIGFTVMKSSKTNVDGKSVRAITEVALWEGSAVLWGANPNTPTLSVAKTMGVYSENDNYTDRFDKIIQALASDRVDTDLKELFRIELLQLKTAFASLQNGTLPAPATKPLKKDLDWDMIAMAIEI